MIVTIDGPAGSGKSTAARALASRLGFRFLDTGAMYRAVAWFCLDQGIDPADELAAAEAAQHLDVKLDSERVLVDGRDVTGEIRSAAVTHAASVVAMNPLVRRRLVELQREVGQSKNIVTEGRDQGTVVFPDAECKFYLTADPRERALRRQKELPDGAAASSLDEVIAQIEEHDRRDRNRDDSPLRRADDAVKIDTSSRTADEVLAELEALVREKMASGHVA